MIIIINLLKKIGIFLLSEFLLIIIVSLFNLLEISSSFTKIMVFISNIIIFFIYGYTSGKKAKRKGFHEGIINGFILIGLFFIISLIFYHNSLSHGSIFYYLTLWTISIISAILGKNKKIESTQD